MKQFYGTKKIQAKEMTRLEYNVFRGWDLPDDENGADEGYLVEYLDGGKPNVSGYAGYVSWSPKEQFEKAYQESGLMNFGHALAALKEGEKVARTGWNGEGMFLFLTEGRDVPNNKERSFADFDGDTVKVCSHIDMKAADGSFVTGWLASQTDMLADDWCIVGGAE